MARLRSSCTAFPTTFTAMRMSHPQLAAQGCRVIVPYLRGFGATRFRDPATLRSGEQAAIGADVIALMDALNIRRAVLGRAQLGWPCRLRRRGTMAGALSRHGDREQLPDPGPRACRWCRSFRNMKSRSGTSIIFSSSAGAPGWPRTGARSPGYCGSNGRRRGISTTPPSIAPSAAHDNPDYVDVVIHSYRHRFGLGGRRSALCGTAAAAGVAAADLRAFNHAGRRQGRRAARERRTAQARPNSPAAVFIAWCRAPDIICRRKRRKHSPLRSWS